MRIVKLKKENLIPFLQGISEGADLWAPVKKYADIVRQAGDRPGQRFILEWGTPSSITNH